MFSVTITTYLCIIIQYAVLYQAQGLNKNKYIMKNLAEKSKFLQSRLVDWVFYKGPELFITIYGK